MTKPLLRWSMGPAVDAGFEVLKYSVNNIKKLYPEFDTILCCNQLNSDRMSLVSKLGVEIIDTTNMLDELNVKMDKGFSVARKLYPPRLREDAHEIWMDSDIIIEKKVPEIDKFLSSDKFLVYQGLNMNSYGHFNEHVNTRLRLNSGIFGLPPRYDFKKELNENIKNYKLKKWSHKFDEQGLVAKTLLEKKYYMISLVSVPIIEKFSNVLPFLNSQTRKGFHFVTVNLENDHEGWSSYKKSKLRVV